MDPEHCVKICVFSDWRGGVLRRGGVGPGPPGGGAGDEGADEEPVRRAGHGGGRALVPPPPLWARHRAYHGGAAQVRQDCRGARGKEGGVVTFANRDCLLQCCGSGSGIRSRFFTDPGSQDHIFEILVTIFWVKSSIIL
jgi:hypothetical protein